MSEHAPTLTALERAAGVVLGSTPGAPRQPKESPYRQARHALEDVVLRALQSRPCVVSFSGGRDSSAMLALAAFVARREGLPLPIPATFRFPEISSTHESEWQELVVRHLGLDHWERIELTTELDLLGEIARNCLTTNGLAWPANAYLHVPIFRVARHGTVITGVDGDGLFGDWRWCHAQAVLHRRAPFTVGDLARIGVAFAPPALRRPAMRRRPSFVPPWLRPEVKQELAATLLDRASSEPRRWDRRVDWHAKSRALTVAIANLDLIAAMDDVRVAHPLLDPTVLTAMAKEGGAVGYGDRTSAMRHLFSDLLPTEMIQRPTKAEFGRAVWRGQARQFAESWDGTGVDHALVDPELLRQAWSAENPVIHSWTLLHAAWLAQHERSMQAESSLN